MFMLKKPYFRVWYDNNEDDFICENPWQNKRRFGSIIFVSRSPDLRDLFCQRPMVISVDCGASQAAGKIDKEHEGQRVGSRQAHRRQGFDDNFRWQSFDKKFSEFLKVSNFFESFQIFWKFLWPETWHLRHWLHFWQLRTTIWTITLWPLNTEWWWQHSQFLRCFKNIFKQLGSEKAKSH